MSDIKGVFQKKQLLDRLEHLHPVIRNTVAVPAIYNGYFTMHKGDVTDAKVHVIVCPVSADFRGGGGVSGMLLGKAGDGLSEDLAAIRSKKENDLSPAIVPIGNKQRGRLRDAVKAVCFVPVPMNTQDDTHENMYKVLRNVYLAVYRKVDECDLFDECVTIAFPLLGAGSNAYPPQLSAEAAFDAFSIFQKVKHNKKISASLIISGDEDFKAAEDAKRFLLFKDMMKQIIEEVFV